MTVASTHAVARPHKQLILYKYDKKIKKGLIFETPNTSFHSKAQCKEIFLTELKLYVEILKSPPSQMWGLFKLAHGIFLVSITIRGSIKAKIQNSVVERSIRAVSEKARAILSAEQK